MNWRNILIVSSLVAILVAGRTLLLACGGGWDSEYRRIFFFLPENGEPVNSHWWFQASHTYSNEVPLDSGLSEDPDYTNLCKEWNTLLGENFPLADVEEMVFWEDSVNNGEIILSDTAKAGVQKVYHAFKKKPELYQYLVEAKQLEYVFIGNYMDWYTISEQELRESQKVYNIKATKLIELANSVKGNKALYEKYLFQIIKLYASGLEHERLQKYYAEFQETNVSPTLQGWGKLYYLGVYPNDSIDQNRMIGEVMLLSPGKTRRCIELFIPMQDTRYIDTVKNHLLKANLLALQAMFDYRPNTNYLSTVAALDPNNILLPELIGREINKYEDYKFTEQLTGYNVLGRSSSQNKYEKAMEDLLPLLTSLSSKDGLKKKNHDYYILALAHAKALTGAASEAQALLKKVNTQHLPHKIQKGITCLYLLSEKDLSNETVLDQLAEQIIDVAVISKNNENVNRCLSGILLKMHKALLEKNKVALSGLCLLNSNMIQVTNNYFTDYTWYELNATHEQYEELEHLLKKEHKRPFEKLLTRGLTLPLIYDSRAKIYLREQNIDSALTYLHKLPELFFIQRYNFLIRSSLFFKEEDIPDRTMNVIEALSVLNEKIKQVNSVKDINTRARENLAIGNAFFEMSNRGNYCFTTGYYSSNYAPHSAGEIKARHPEPLFRFYYKAEPAFAYFQKAKEQSKDKELSAAIQYHYMRAFDEVYGSTNDNEIPKDGWILYFKNYSQTSFYKHHSCPGIEWYLEKAS